MMMVKILLRAGRVVADGKRRLARLLYIFLLYSRPELRNSVYGVTTDNMARMDTFSKRLLCKVHSDNG